MLDATSKIQSGILEGNINDFGNYDECLAVDKEVEKRHIKGKYCLGNINGLSQAYYPRKEKYYYIIISVG